MIQRALLTLALSLTVSLTALAQEEAPTRLAADTWVGLGYYHLPAAGGEERFEAGFQQAQVGFRPLRRVVDESSGGAFELGGLVRYDGVLFSSRNYDGYRAQPGIGLDVLWSDLPTAGLFYTVALRPYVAYAFESSQIAGDARDTLHTFLAGVQLAASFYRLAPPPEPGVAAGGLRWLTELHVSVAYEHDLDPEDTSAPASAGLTATAEARRQVGRGAGSGAGGGGGGGVAGSGGVRLVELQDDERDLSVLAAELTVYTMAWEGEQLTLAAGGVAGLRQHRAAFYLTEEAGDPIHTVYGGPLVRVGFGGGLHAFASATARWEVEVDRVGWGVFGAVLWVY